MPSKIPQGGLLRFNLPESSILNQNEASSKIINILSRFHQVRVIRVFHKGTKEIFVDAIFPFSGYIYIRDRFKSECELGTPMLIPRQRPLIQKTLKESQKCHNVYGIKYNGSHD